VEPGVCGGKPCVRGMRITVRRVLELLATYPDRTDLLREAIAWAEGAQASARVTKVDISSVDVDDPLKPGSPVGPSHT